MLKQAIFLWKQERSRQGTPLQRRLFAFFICMAAFLILTFVALLLLFNINGRGTEAVRHFLDSELSHLNSAVSADFGRLSVQGCSFSEQVSDNIEAFCRKEGISVKEIQKHPQLLEPLLSEQMQAVRGVIERNTCSGAFILLNATVSPQAEGSENSRAGIFLIRTLPNTVDSVSSELHYLRGPANIARENGVELLGQWKMEFQIQNQPFFQQVMQTAQENRDLPLSRLYYWSDRVTLEGNSESGFLLCVPLRAEDGTVFGVCGMEVSNRLFKQAYSPSGSTTYPNVFAAAAPVDETSFCMDRGMIAGNYYLTSARMGHAFQMVYDQDGFCCYRDGRQSLGGLHTGLKLYPKDSAFEQQKWAVSVMMPLDTLNQAVDGNSRYLLIIVLLLLGVSLIASIFISRRYLKPVTEALDRIKTKDYAGQTKTPYLEINDLMEFLAQQDEEVKSRSLPVNEPAGDVMPMFECFLENIKTLSPAERNVFDLYLHGYKAQEIADELHLSINTIKTHNRRIFAKLHVSTRKELLVYIGMMKELHMISEE